MNYKISQVLYYVHADEDTGKVSIDEWIVRTIRGGRVYAIVKTPWTWVKLSNKHFDWGWAKDIPNYCRDSCREGEKMAQLHTTELAALRARLKSSYCPDNCKRTLKTMITRRKK